MLRKPQQIRRSECEMLRRANTESLKDTGMVVSVAFSPDGNWLVPGAYDDTIRLWDVHLGVPTHSKVVVVVSTVLPSPPAVNTLPRAQGTMLSVFGMQESKALYANSSLQRPHWSCPICCLFTRRPISYRNLSGQHSESLESVGRGRFSASRLCTAVCSLDR